MRVARVCAACCAVFAVIWSGAPRVAAQASPTADSYEQFIERARAAFRARQFEQARNLFEQAHALQPSARTLRGLGVSAFSLGRYTLAKPELEAALQDERNPLTPEQRTEVIELLSWMRSSLGSLRLELRPAHAIALVDEHALPAGTHLLELGTHALQVRASGYTAREQTFALQRGAPLSLRVELDPLPADPALARKAPTAPLSGVPTVTDAAGRDTSPSLLKQWWFWTAAALVVGAGTLALVALTHEPTVRPLPQGTRVPTN
jgi:tetratricopeptide (TPR) repeat protein